MKKNKYPPYSIDEFREWQKTISEKVSLVNKLPVLESLETIAGADVSCNRFSKEGHAAVVVLSYPDLKILEHVYVSGLLTIPYIPGYLAFREWPLVHECLKKLETPLQVLLCDGQGIAHPRRAGLASHIGVTEDIITIGCAKSRLVGEYVEPEIYRGSKSDLLYEGNKVGEILRTRDGVKPVFVSPGHKIDCMNASQLVLNLCRRYRLPEPIREAHKLVNQVRKDAGCQH